MNPGMGRIFIFATTFNPALGPTQNPIS